VVSQLPSIGEQSPNKRGFAIQEESLIRTEVLGMYFFRVAGRIEIGG
jgi:hypothetical protein